MWENLVEILKEAKSEQVFAGCERNPSRDSLFYPEDAFLLTHSK
jgi:hypothetical protein